jgi:hypothetical protein
MTQTTTIICDECGKSLIYTKYSYEYFITTSNTSKINRDGTCFAMGIEPSFARDHHFCNMKCLTSWVNGEK